MSWLFTLALLIHLLAALLMTGALGLQATITLLVRRAATPAEVRRLVDAGRWIPRAFAPATLLLLLSGCYMGAMLILAGVRWGWMAVAFVSLVGIALWSKSTGRRRNMALGRLAADCDSSLSPELCAAQQDPAPLAHTAVGGWAIAGVVVLMVYRPDIWISIAVMVVALLAAAAMRALMFAGPAAEPAEANAANEV
ncbi:MAG TPA: hypothetical protein VFH85_06345 [Gammaproteobacteria bacterium]|nr:hypothetical protein [Gammaproteobacteria bacterium]